MLRSLVLAMMSPCVLFSATTVLFDPSTPETGPFPSDVLTVSDPLQKTGLRIALPFPDCATQVTACQETALLNQLDGFSVRARLRVRFSGAVNPSTVPGNIYFVAFDNLTSDEVGIHRLGERIVTDQVIFDPATNTIYAKPDSVLDQHRRYLLVVTDGVRDAAGAGVAADPAFSRCLQASDSYCAALSRAVGTVNPGIAQKIAGASLFTTMSATAWLEQARDVLPRVSPMASVLKPQSAFSIADITSIVLHDQIGANPPRFSDLALPINTSLLAGVDRIVIGSYRSPNFLEDDQTIREVPTLLGFQRPRTRHRPQRAESNQVFFNAILPGTPKPPGGYPVVIFGHGFGDSRFGGPTAVAPTLARAGFAVIAINAVGHGFGPLSTVSFIDKNGGNTTVNAGGRSLDVNGDGVIEGNEGCALETPVALGPRDCFRQTVVDLMQLAHVLRLGLDLDGDGIADLDGGHIYYGGQSLGAIYGAMFMALEPTVRAAALNVGGASVTDIARWSPAYRGLVTDSLRIRRPPLLNKGNAYDDDYVLPQLPPKTTTGAGAIAIQNVLETLEWLGTSGDDMAFAPHLVRSPLPGVPARPVLIQFARGDQTVINPANSGLVKASGLLANTWMYRHDLAKAKAPDLPTDPHPFLVLFVSLDGGAVTLPGINALAVSLDAQQQLATFFGADGASIPDPNSLVQLLFGMKLFEQPSVLPWDFGFVQ